MKASLLRKIENRQAVIGVIGLGYVGLPLVFAVSKAGFPVIGFDIDPAKIAKLNANKSYIKHIGNRLIHQVNASGRFTATTDFSKIKTCDAILVCVPTPLTVHREPDLRYVENTIREIKQYFRRGQLVSLESTTYPGTMDDLVLPILQKGSTWQVGRDFFLAFSPEREDPGNAHFTTDTIPKIVGGMTPACGDVACALYGAIVEKVVRVAGTREAEMAKLLENIFRAVNIALVNEMKTVADRMGIDIWDVIEAAKSKPFGFMPFYPGPGLGGHCIPIDPFYLTWKAREYKVSTRFIELAGEINTAMPEYVVERTQEALGKRGVTLYGSKILVLGAAYKKNIDDLRESPSLELLRLLQEKGVQACYHDPYIPKLPRTRKYALNLRSVPLTEEMLSQMAAVIISTNHDCFDLPFIATHAPLLIDTRGAMRPYPAFRDKVVGA